MSDSDDPDPRARRQVAGPTNLPPEFLGRRAIQHRIATGRLVRLARGAYVHPQLEWSSHRDVLTVALAAPDTTFSLLTALHLLGIGAVPAEVWISIGHHDRAPSIEGIPIAVVRCKTRPPGEEAIQLIGVETLQVRVTSAARTVADCFKARNRIGLDISVGALRSVRRRGLASADEIWSEAVRNEVCAVMSPYLRSLA